MDALALAQRSDAPRPGDEAVVQRFARAVVERIRPDTPTAQPRAAPPLDAALTAALLTESRALSSTSADVDGDGEIEHLVLFGPYPGREMIFVVADCSARDWRIAFWDVVSSRYEPPPFVVWSSRSGPPPFGFPELVGGTGTGYYESVAQFYQFRAGTFRRVLSVPARISLGPGAQPRTSSLESRISWQDEQGFQVAYLHRFDWPAAGFSESGRTMVSYRWDDQRQAYRPHRDAADDAPRQWARRLAVIEAHLTHPDDVIRAAFASDAP